MSSPLADDVRPLRLGVILPSVNTVVEPWFSRTLPTDINLHAARMLIPPTLSPESIIEMDRSEGTLAVRQMASCRPAVIGYCCTASSVVQGQAYDAHLRQEIERETGAKATTATHAILSALSALKARRIVIVSPYTDDIDAMEHHFFADAGLDVVGSANLSITDTFHLAEPGKAQIVTLARHGWRPEADALIITCLNLHSHFAVGQLERELGKPVISSTTSMLWHMLRLAGRADQVEGYGRLLTLHAA